MVHNKFKESVLEFHWGLMNSPLTPSNSWPQWIAWTDVWTKEDKIYVLKSNFPTLGLYHGYNQLHEHFYEFMYKDNVLTYFGTHGKVEKF